MSKGLLDLLKIEKVNLDGKEYYFLQLGLKIMSPSPSEWVDVDREEVSKFLEEELVYLYLRRLMELVFNYLETKKLKELKIMDCDIIIDPMIKEDCIIIHPATFSRLLREDKFKKLWKGIK